LAYVLRSGTEVHNPYVKSAMCEQCEELDKKISHYRKLASSLTDEPTLLGIKELIDEAEAERGRSTLINPLIERKRGGPFSSLAR
jgi:hypothetical protein